MGSSRTVLDRKDGLTLALYALSSSPSILGCLMVLVIIIFVTPVVTVGMFSLKLGQFCDH